MSSLSAQLGNIAQANASVALDRKTRHKLHAASLIFDAKTAATQDYELIFTLGLEGLEEMETIDRRFGRFKLSLFSETAVQIDRNVQSRAEGAALDAAVEAFLALVAPHLHLAPAVKATEWLVRRFQIHLHNGEALLAATLPHHAAPLFLRVLALVRELPLVFSWLEGYRKSGANPPRRAVVKGFANAPFFRFYSQFLLAHVARHTAYAAQLVFYVSCTVSLMAAAPARFDEEFVPVVLATAGAMLLPSLASDAKVAAHLILAVLAATASLSDALARSVLDSLWDGYAAAPLAVRRSAVLCAAKVAAMAPTAAVPAGLGACEMVAELAATHPAVRGLLVKGAVAQLARAARGDATADIAADPATPARAAEAAELVVAADELTESHVHALVAAAVAALGSDNAALVPLFRLLAAHDSFATAAAAAGVTRGDVEMALTCSLGDAEGAESDADVEDEADEGADEEAAAPADAANAADAALAASYLTFHQDDFSRLCSAFVAAVAAKTTNAFFARFSAPAVSMTFLLRVAGGSTAPMRARLVAMRLIGKRARALKRDEAVHLLIPFASALCAHPNATMRSLAAEVLRALAARDPAAHHLFLETELYGEAPLALILPAAGQALAERLIAGGITDASLIRRAAVAAFADKKSGKVAYAFFVAQAVAWRVPAVKAALLELVAAAAPSRAALLQPVFEQHLAQRAEWTAACAASGFPLASLDAAVLAAAQPRDTVTFLLPALAVESVAEAAACRAAALFSALLAEMQDTLAAAMVRHAATDAPYDAVAVLLQLDLAAPRLVRLLEACALNQTMPAGVAKRRRRSSSAKHAMKDEGVVRLAADHLRRVTVVLELAARGAAASPELLHALFLALGDLETLGADGNLPVLYAQETAAAAMLRVADALRAAGVTCSALAIRADVIVATIRASPLPQVQNRLLLVVAALARLAPETVLHSVMPIFTFMGAHTVRQDDAFLAHVVEQTITCVVPALCAAAARGAAEEIEFLLASFASAFAHIPRHRRVRLFSTLATTLGVAATLDRIVFLAAGQYAAACGRHRAAEARALVEFGAAFLRAFSAPEQLAALRGAVDLWLQIPAAALDPDSAALAALAARPVFGAAALATTAELQAMRADVLAFLHLALAGADTVPALRVKVAAVLLDPRAAPEHLDAISDAFRALLGTLLAAVPAAPSPILDLLATVLDLLPPAPFTDAVAAVLEGDAPAPVLRHLVVLVAAKFGVEDVAARDVETLLPLLSLLVGRDAALSQAALDTTAALVARFGAQVLPKHLTAALSTATGVICTATGTVAVPSPPAAVPVAVPVAVLIGALNAVASLVAVLGVRAIGFFPKILPPAFALADSASPLVQTAVVAVLLGLVRRLPAFMASSLEATLLVVVGAAIPETTRAAALDGLVQHMEPVASLKALAAAWEAVRPMDATAVGLFLHAMGAAVGRLDKRSATLLAPLFVRWVLRAFEFRVESALDANAVFRVEAAVSQCAIDYVMKLNDKTFRPLFAKMVRWADGGEGTGLDGVARWLAFLRFFNKLQELLKAVVTSYYAYVLEPVALLLESTTDTSLRRLVFISLTSSLKYDQDEFWQQLSRFTVVSQSLTAQAATLEDLIGKYWVKAMAAVAQTAVAEAQTRALNDLMLSHMRLGCLVSEKVWTIRALKTVYHKVGDRWLALLPQLVPVIAELLEDEEEVEMEVRSGLVRAIEAVLGEPLDRYLD